MKKMFIKSFVAAVVWSLLTAVNASATSTVYNVAGPLDSPGSSVALSNITTWYYTSIGADLVANLDDELFSLDTGDSYEFDFLSISLDGNGLGSFDISASLAFETPEIVSNSNGGGMWFTTEWSGSYTAGALTWEDNTPDHFIVNGDYITIDFLDLSGCAPTQDFIVTATVTNHGAVNSVPEPANMMLLGTGLVGLACVSRRRKNLK